MSEVSVIGLGPLGSALARTLLDKGHRVTVWNRTASRADPLVRAGASLAPNAAAAVAASPVVIICVFDYDASRRILDAADVIANLPGKTLIQLSTGTPQEARDLEAWARQHKADYLDGAVLATPSQIGQPDTPLFASGSAAAFRRTEPLLKSLAGSLTYMGDSVGAASAWDFATLSCLFGAFLGFFHGALIIESEGFSVDSYGDKIADIAPVMGAMLKHAAGIIHRGSFANPQSSVSISHSFFEQLAKHAQQARINSDFPNYALPLFRKAIAAGQGNEELASLIKLLRTSN